MVSLGTAVHKGKIYAFGGWDGRDVLDTVEVYNPLTDRWTTKAAMPVPNGTFGISVVNGKIYIIGGVNPADDGPVSRVDIYDPDEDTWTTDVAPPMPTARSTGGAASVNGKIYVFGGWTWPGIPAAVEAYTPDAGLAVSPQGKLLITWGEMKRER